MKKSNIQALRDSCIALMEAMNASRQSRTEDIWLFSSFKTFMRKYNDIAVLVGKELSADLDIPIEIYDLDKVPSPYDTITVQQRVFFDEVYSNLSILKSFIDAHGGLADAQADNILNFLKANLRKAIFNEPKNEKDIQNAIEGLLVGKGLQKGLGYDRETGRVKVAGKESIPDFIFPPEGMALEVKISNRTGKLSSIIDEMNADIVAYSEMYRLVRFLIYDMGFIRDEDEIIDGLEKAEHVKCVVVKH